MGKAAKPTLKTSSRTKAATGGKATAPPKTTAAKEKRLAAHAVALRPVPLYEFTAGGIAGHVRLSDPGRGIEFTSSVYGGALPAYSQEVLSLRHYFAIGDSGLLAPREEAPCEARIERSAVVFSYDRLPKWPVAATARYDLLPDGGADAAFTFTFSKPLKRFEAGIETLMPKSQPNVYVHSGGNWVRVAVQPQAQKFYPRNLGAAELIVDGRWDALRLGGVWLAVEPQGYDYPIVVVRDERTGWAFAYMALTEDCSAVWVNGAQRTVGLSLIAADVKAQEKAHCRLRVALCQAEKLDGILIHYRRFVQEARARK
jgi:hypothetical protein